jgi:hypothetical protein
LRGLLPRPYEMDTGVLKKAIAISIAIFFVQNIYSIDIFCSARGDIGIGYNIPDNNYEGQFNMGVIDLIERNLKIGFNVTLLRLELINTINTDTNMEYSFLPVEIYYRPLKFGRIFHLTLYGRSEWQFRGNSQEGLNPAGTETKNYFLGTIGWKISILPTIWQEILPYYSPHISLSFEYNTLNQFKTGLTMDLLGWLIGLMSGIVIIPP